MNIKHDSIADAQYIYLKKGKISYTKKEAEWVLYDYNKEGQVLGIEILNVSRNPLAGSILKKLEVKH